MSSETYFNIDKLLRTNIRDIKPYSSARDEYTGAEGTFLDANENAFGSAADNGYNRYPDPLQRPLKTKIAQLKGVLPTQTFLGNGSDEAIDLLFRAFCEPKVDNVVILPPTYGMYRVCADINDVEVREAQLTRDFDIDVESVKKVIDDHTKLLFICSPNNPTGNLMTTSKVLELLTFFKGLVVVDEAYIDFAEENGFVGQLEKYPNLVVLQTFSKAWGMAALRLGMAFASNEIINVLNKIKYPYNINEATQRIALDALDKEAFVNESIELVKAYRDDLVTAMKALEVVEYVYPSSANFIMVKTTNAVDIYNYLVDEHKVIVRDRSSVTLCEGCLRITIGTAKENALLLEALKLYKQQS